MSACEVCAVAGEGGHKLWKILGLGHLWPVNTWESTWVSRDREVTKIKLTSMNGFLGFATSQEPPGLGSKDKSDVRACWMDMVRPAQQFTSSGQLSCYDVPIPKHFR